MGNITSVTDSEGNITNGNGVVGITSETYSYDELGRMIEANDSYIIKTHYISVFL